MEILQLNIKQLHGLQCTYFVIKIHIIIASGNAPIVEFKHNLSSLTAQQKQLTGKGFCNYSIPPMVKKNKTE